MNLGKLGQKPGIEKGHEGKGVRAGGKVKGGKSKENMRERDKVP